MLEQNKSLEEKIGKIDEQIMAITNIQKSLVLLENKNHSVIMKKLNKMQEYNEISDMTNQVFEKRISNIEEMLSKIVNKLSA